MNSGWHKWTQMNSPSPSLCTDHKWEWFNLRNHGVVWFCNISQKIRHFHAFGFAITITTVTITVSIITMISLLTSSTGGSGPVSDRELVINGHKFPPRSFTVIHPTFLYSYVYLQHHHHRHNLLSLRIPPSQWMYRWNLGQWAIRLKFNIGTALKRRWQVKENIEILHWVRYLISLMATPIKSLNGLWPQLWLWQWHWRHQIMCHSQCQSARINLGSFPKKGHCRP